VDSGANGRLRGPRDPPAHFELFNPSPIFPAQCADLIAASYNPQLANFYDVAGGRRNRTYVILPWPRVRTASPNPRDTSLLVDLKRTTQRGLCASTNCNGKFASTDSRAFLGSPLFRCPWRITRRGTRSRIRVASAALQYPCWRPMGANGWIRVHCAERSSRAVSLPMMIAATGRHERPSSDL
jgi:hypothetical protein